MMILRPKYTSNVNLKNNDVGLAYYNTLFKSRGWREGVMYCVKRDCQI